MNKAALQYTQLVYFYRLLLVRYLVLYNLVSLLAENSLEEEPSLGEKENTAEPPLEPADCFEKGRIGQQVTGKELDEETGYYYFGARYYDPKISSWISTDPALAEYLPTGKQVYFPEEKFDASKLKGSGGIFNSINGNAYQYAALNPIKFIDPDGKAHFAKRALEGFPWLGLASSNPVDNYLNTEVSHEQLFFDDGSNRNVGFFKGSSLPRADDPQNISKYKHEKEYFDDKLMDKAVKGTKKGEYSLLGDLKKEKNNCQDFTDRVKGEYKKLYDKLPDSEKLKIQEKKQEVEKKWQETKE
jgi:uncharacterized protein RhaS with RHS repeats